MRKRLGTYRKKTCSSIPPSGQLVCPFLLTSCGGYHPAKRPQSLKLLWELKTYGLISQWALFHCIIGQCPFCERGTHKEMQFLPSSVERLTVTAEMCWVSFSLGLPFHLPGPDVCWQPSMITFHPSVNSKVVAHHNNSRSCFSSVQRRLIKYILCIMLLLFLKLPWGFP